MTTTIISLIIIIIFSALFSGMEIAFVASNKFRMEIDMNNKTVTSRILDKFYRNSNNFVSSLLVGNNIVLVIYGILMANLLNSTILATLNDTPSVQLLLQTIISTIIIIITGEFVPKALFRINPNSTMKRFAMPTFLFYVLLYPLARFTTWLACLIMRLFNIKINKEVRDTTFSKMELTHLIQSSIENAKDDEETIDNDVRIFQNALDFSDIRVRDCFVPRTEVWAVELNTSLEELKQQFIESGHSKIIVYKENIDNIIGYIHSSELFRNAREWQKQICRMPIVPETLSAQKLMRTLMQQKKTLAAVVDEFGGTSGIISLEDLLEEIIGEIEDEHDNTNHEATKISDSEYHLSGRLEVERINEQFNLELPESDEYQTLGGMILSYHQSFPQLNETITIGKYQFKILKKRSTKIELVKLKIIE
ncbi:MAG: HlyC/CorC family transporter [Bacteroidaceae bacterium]|nr:HlyC/CorC family transporter [Bacteroidaceae bacterium]